jgi:hypothetical protein
MAKGQVARGYAPPSFAGRVERIEMPFVDEHESNILRDKEKILVKKAVCKEETYTCTLQIAESVYRDEESA